MKTVELASATKLQKQKVEKKILKIPLVRGAAVEILGGGEGGRDFEKKYLKKEQHP